MDGDPNDSFEAVFRGVRDRNGLAEEEVFRRFAGRLVGLARARLDQRLPTKVDPEDVVQSAFRSFFVRCADDRFDLGSWDSLWSLLTVITVRKCAGQARSVNRILQRMVGCPGVFHSHLPEDASMACGSSRDPDKERFWRQALRAFQAGGLTVPDTDPTGRSVETGHVSGAVGGLSGCRPDNRARCKSLPKNDLHSRTGDCRVVGSLQDVR